MKERSKWQWAKDKGFCLSRAECQLSSFAIDRLELNIAIKVLVDHQKPSVMTLGGVDIVITV